MAIMPPYLPLHLELVYLSGVFEILLGSLLCVPKTPTAGRVGPHSFLLIAVFPANIHLAMSTEAQAALGTIRDRILVDCHFRPYLLVSLTGLRKTHKNRCLAGKRFLNATSKNTRDNQIKVFRVLHSFTQFKV